jgi:hypothetical protein
MAQPAGASASLPPPKINTFRAFYQDRANNPYRGEYATAMVFFNEDAPVQGSQALFYLVAASSPKMGVLVGMYEDPNHEEGRSLAFHGIKTFCAILGRPTKWALWPFALVNDVVGGGAQSVEFLPEMFNRDRKYISTCQTWDHPC